MIRPAEANTHAVGDPRYRRAMTRSTAAALLMLSLAACGTDYDIPATPLAGKVGGQPWTFVAGETNFFLSEGEDDFFAELYPMAYEACGFGAPQGDHLIVAVPKAPGDYEFSLSLNMTFVVGDAENLVTFDGRVVVDEVTATTVRGGLHGVYDDDNEVSGRFELSVCPDATP
jgi:hypothetical protein